MYEKKFVKVTFAESLQWPVYNYLLCNKKDSCRLQLVQTEHKSKESAVPTYDKYVVELVNTVYLWQQLVDDGIMYGRTSGNRASRFTDRINLIKYDDVQTAVWSHLFKQQDVTQQMC